MTAIIKVFTSVKDTPGIIFFLWPPLIIPINTLYIACLAFEALKILPQRNIVVYRELAGSCINWLRLQHEDYVIQEVVRLS